MPPSSFFSDRRILVTGATGLIGSVLVRHLMAMCVKSHIYALGRSSERAACLFSQYESSQYFHFIRHDVTLPLPCNHDFDYIFHLAGNTEPHAMAARPLEVIHANIRGTDHLLEYGRTHNMRRMLYVSSAEVYGTGEKGRLCRETDSGCADTMRPRNCGAFSKCAAEALCTAYHAQYSCDVVVARPCHIYGASFTEQDSRVYAQFIRNIREGQDIIVKSSGEQCRTWLYVADCVSALLHIMQYGAAGEAYNVADEASYLSIREIGEILAHLSGRRLVISTVGDTSFTAAHHAKLCTAKLQALGWSPQFSPRSAFRQLLEHDQFIPARERGKCRNTEGANDKTREGKTQP